jgi:thymidylate kinase
MITIFEGPDGAGKTVAARAYAETTGAAYVHHGPYPGEKVISWRYYESMKPAFRRERPVVLDRCWISEPIYGAAFRGGEDRLTADDVTYLEGVARAGRAVVVMCLPDYEAARASFRERKGREMLADEAQLRAVWDGYARLLTPPPPPPLSPALPTVRYDYERDEWPELLSRVNQAREVYR